MFERVKLDHDLFSCVGEFLRVEWPRKLEGPPATDTATMCEM